MNVKVRTDVDSILQAADAVDAFIIQCKKRMASADAEIAGLAAVWQGRDYLAFQSSWNSLHEPGSAYERLVTALQNYSDYLREAARQYKRAQDACRIVSALL